MTDKQEKALYIAKQFLAAGMTLSGVAGSIANIDAESAFKSTNVQDSYERGLGMNDAQYTAAVDNGTYTRFTVDQVGYGLAQWTARDRKDGMLKFHRARGKSIGDFETQVAWWITEMRGYQTVWNTCRSSDDPYLCGYNVCKYYEMPADTEAAAKYRGRLAQEWFAFLSKYDLTEKKNIQTIAKDPISATFPPDPSIKQIQYVMYDNGYWDIDKINGYKTKEFFEKLRTFVDDMESC